jgi:hypothetical protein
MTNEQWTAFAGFRDRFRAACAQWLDTAGGETGWLAQLQKEAADSDETPAYPIETPIVYNRSLDALTRGDEIKLIVVGDNPGKDEQLERNRRYLVGQAGKLGDGFFRRNPELGIDFRRNAVILNKTPIHTAKTRQIAYLRRNGGDRFASLLAETQLWMARETAALAEALGCGLWLVGYGELKPAGLFAEYAAELTRCGHGDTSGLADSVRLYQHFSMNRFSIDLKDRAVSGVTLAENLARIGQSHRREILGW